MTDGEESTSKLPIKGQQPASILMHVCTANVIGTFVPTRFVNATSPNPHLGSAYDLGAKLDPWPNDRSEQSHRLIRLGRQRQRPGYKEAPEHAWPQILYLPGLERTCTQLMRNPLGWM